MHLTSVNVAQPQQLGRFKTGIVKVPQTESLRLSKLGIEGDHVLDKKFHGGEDQAIYVYGQTDYDWWESKLERTLTPGTFGENLTIGELSCQSIHIGDQFRIGDVEIEVTAPRIPCAVLGEKMGDSKFPIAFKAAERPGFYCRVLAEGTLEPGISIHYLPVDSADKLALLDLFRLNYQKNPSRPELEMVLNSPIASRERERILHLLNEMVQ